MREVYVVVEGAADACSAAILIDRIIEAGAHRYRGIDASTPFTRRGPPEQQMTYTKWGHLKGLPGSTRARGREGHATRAARKALSHIALVDRSRPVVVLIRDDDRKHRLAEHAPRLADEFSARLHAIIGVPNPEMEMWRLHAYEPGDDGERARLAAQRRALGADPRDLDPATVHSGRTHDKHTGEAIKRNAKNILAALTDGDPHRADHGLANTPLDTLSERGTRSGLADFIRSVETCPALTR